MTTTTSPLSIDLQTIHRGFDGKRCWVHARAGVIPGRADQPGKVGGGRGLGVLTMQPLELRGSDVFFSIHAMLTRDGGQTWQGPIEQTTLQRWQEDGGVEACVCDFVPKWHAASGTLLGTGHVARYVGDRLMPPPRPRQVAYAVFDPVKETFGPRRLIDLSGEPAFFNAGAGSAQRVDLPNGEILLPIYGRDRQADLQNGPMSARVLRCGFDGQTLTVKTIGQPMSVPIDRGLYEPSLAEYAGRYYLTLRNDRAGYVAVGDDGLSFSAPKPWTFDDGSDLGNYNTQQHWLVRHDGLYLVYTRRGLDNDHVTRHRAPLVLAKVDTDRLCIIRATEQIVIPQRGARLGNFSVTHLNDRESWVTVAEWMQPVGCEKYGSDNSVYVARVGEG